jgi:hypothetical protein
VVARLEALAQVRDEMEGTWQKRLEALRQRESEFNEKLSKREADSEQQLYAHRQRMLSDMETVRRRDAESAARRGAAAAAASAAAAVAPTVVTATTAMVVGGAGEVGRGGAARGGGGTRRGEARRG